MTTSALATTSRRLVVGAIASCVCTLAFVDAGGAESKPVTRRVIVDPQVTSAGGAGCRGCESGQCRLHGHCGLSHHPECRDGECVPFCPVRPSTFGFYGTQWRRWPGQGVVPASAEDAATPMPPATSAVPGPDEESPTRPDDAAETSELQPDVDAGERSDSPEGASVPDPTVELGEPMPPAKPKAADDIVPAPAVPAPRSAPEKEPLAPADKPEPAKPDAPAKPAAPKRLPSLEDILDGAEEESAPKGEPVPRDADDTAAPGRGEPLGSDALPDVAPPDGARDGGTKTDDDGNPFEDDSASKADGGVTLTGFRYPDTVGGSLQPGGRPWQLAPPKRQRSAGSARGR